MADVDQMATDIVNLIKRNLLQIEGFGAWYYDLGDTYRKEIIEDLDAEVADYLDAHV